MAGMRFKTKLIWGNRLVLKCVSKTLTETVGTVEISEFCIFLILLKIIGAVIIYRSNI